MPGQQGDHSLAEMVSIPDKPMGSSHQVNNMSGTF